MLDAALRIKSFLSIDEKDYCADGIVDYVKYRGLMERLQKRIRDMAKVRRFSKLNVMIAKSQEEAAKEHHAPIGLGEFVVLKRPRQAKNRAENEPGYVVRAIERSGAKWRYTLRHPISNKTVRTNRAHIRRMHRPLHRFDCNAADRIIRMEEDRMNEVEDDAQ